MFKNDERYWDINLLNKWFGISSLIFLFCMVWVFIDDNDDEFKIYQKKFRELEIDITQNNLDKELETVKESRKELEKKLADAKENYISRSNEVESIEKTLTDAQAESYKANMDFQGQKAIVDEIKFLVESENIHDSSHEQGHRKDYDKALELANVALDIVYYNKSLTLIRMKRWDDARTALETALEINPKSSRVKRKLQQFDEPEAKPSPAVVNPYQDE